MNKPLFALGVSLLLLGIGMLYGVSVVAHPGGLDANGCHNNNALGVYECHSGRYEGTTWGSREAFDAKDQQQANPVVISLSGIDWTTLRENPPNLFNRETVYTVVGGETIYMLRKIATSTGFTFEVIGEAAYKNINDTQVVQLIKAISEQSEAP